MYFILGLPVDYEITDEDLLVTLRGHNSKVEILTVPSFVACDLDTLFHVSNIIANVEKVADSLFRKFTKTMRSKSIPVEIDKKSLDYAIKTFKWQSRRFSDRTIGRLCDTLKESIESFVEAFNERKNEYEKTKKSLIDKIKDMEILAENYDFITEHFIVVLNGREGDFMKLMNEMYGSEEIHELILKDDENSLYKLFGVKSNSEEVKKMVTSRGFGYKQPVPIEIFQSKKIEREENKRKAHFAENNLELYLIANVDEIFTLFMHVKVLRVYVESVLLYGMGNYVFFYSQGRNTTRELTKIVSEWRFSKRINKDEIEEGSFAYVMIDDSVDDEIR